MLKENVIKLAQEKMGPTCLIYTQKGSVATICIDYRNLISIFVRDSYP